MALVAGKSVLYCWIVCLLTGLGIKAISPPGGHANTSAITETTSFCGGIITHSFGNITSPNYPGHYSDGLNCIWQFQAGHHHRFTFQFHKGFCTELGYDRVSIYDGTTTKSPMIAELSGNATLSHIIVTKSNTATIRFTTDNSLTFRGFSLYYSTEPIPACGGVLHTDGKIETPDFPAHYPSSTECRWIITAREPNNKIALVFESFQTEPGRDFLTVTDPISDQPLLIHSGFTVPQELVSPSNQLVLTFQSDYIVNHSGFEISYKII